MAGYANNMTKLLNKIETRLGTEPLKLPDFCKKESWAEKVIIPDTLVTFSRYYPYQFKYYITPDHKKKNGYYLLDEEYLDGATILGIRDISWSDFGADSLSMQENAGYGMYDYLSTGFSIDDIGLLQSRADMMSLFNNGYYPEFIPPNKLKITSATNTNIGVQLGTFAIYLLVEHSPNLTTISPTQMETFESLAQADVANFLYKNLKYYEGLQTVYATIDLKLSDLETEAQKREEVINYIKESYVSASNQNQPYILTV